MKARQGNSKTVHVVGDGDFRNGMVVAARLMAAREGSVVETCRDFAARRTLDGVAEVVVHGCWLPRYWSACLKVLWTRGKGPVPRLVRMPHGSLDPVRLAYHGWKKRLVAPVERWLFAHCDGVLVTGLWERDWCEGWGVGGPYQVVDLKVFFNLSPSDAAVSRAEGPLRVLYLGRRHPLKGVAYLEAAAESVGAECRIVSDHADGELERDWAWCDALCLPTLSENFGLVVAEALSRGKRVVVTDGAPAWRPSETAGAPYVPRIFFVDGFRRGSVRDRITALAAALAELAVARSFVVSGGTTSAGMI